MQFCPTTNRPSKLPGGSERCTVDPHISDPHVSGYSDYPTYPLHWYSIVQNSIVVCSLYFAKCVFLHSNIGFSFQLTHESSTTCVHESTVIPCACTCSCSSLLHLFHISGYYTYLNIRWSH